MKIIPKFTKALKEKWVKALRSGRYNQGVDALKVRHDDGKLAYCCLGVLCSVAKFKSADEGMIKNEKGHFIILPPATQRLLATMNDSDDYNFNAIANHIEKKVKVRKNHAKT